MDIEQVNSENCEIAKSNLEQRKRVLIQLLEKTEPDYYLVGYNYGALGDEMEIETLQGAFAIFDLAIRSGAKFALLRALYNAPDASGEVYINIGIHEL